MDQRFELLLKYISVKDVSLIIIGYIGPIDLVKWDGEYVDDNNVTIKDNKLIWKDRKEVAISHSGEIKQILGNDKFVWIMDRCGDIYEYDGIVIIRIIDGHRMALNNINLFIARRWW